MLDTNAVRVLLERRSPQLDQWFAEDRCSVSAIVAAEIRFDLERRRLPEQQAALVQNLLEVLPVATGRDHSGSHGSIDCFPRFGFGAHIDQ